MNAAMTNGTSHAGGDPVGCRSMKRRSRGFTLVELLVVIGVIAVLIGLLLPSLSKARKSSERTRCLSNLHQIAVAYQLYLQEYKQRVMRINPIPTEPSLLPFKAPSLVEVLNPYLGNTPTPPLTPTGVPVGNGVFQCPSDQLSAKDSAASALTLPPNVNVTTYFDAEGTSYEYNFYFNASSVDPDTGVNRVWNQALADARSARQFLPLAPEDLPLLLDFGTFHGPPDQMQSKNAMFADFHADVLNITVPWLAKGSQ
jgi:prepilin-type N-terminal cleavage/methylation domain-containing protein